MRKQGKDLKIIVNNLTVSYNDEGPDDAPVIIFIHGFPFNKFMWNMQVEAQEDNYRVITYDVRGHGSSDAGAGDFSIELFVDDLFSLMEALKIDKTMLGGLSMGSYIALNAIEQTPKYFNALILCDTNCNGDTMKEEITEVSEMITNTSKETICKTLNALSVRVQTCDKLPGIKVPVLMMVGKKDKITPSSATHLMHKKIKGSIIHIIGHARHLSNSENPTDLNKQLRKFVESVY